MSRIKAGLLKRLNEAWLALLSSYEGLSEPEMLESGVMGAWSIKDVIGHVTTWEEESLQHLPTVLAGRRPPHYSMAYGGLDAFNALKVEENRRLSLTEVLHQRDLIHQKLIQYLQSVPEDQLVSEMRFRRRLRLDTYGHYRLHAEAILGWRKRARMQNHCRKM